MSENYVPLYRKYRPQTLDKLVGQEHIKKTLKSAIELGKIAHAFLFTGPRGTGKTSTARILAKSLNCKNGPTINPCGECESCKDITNTVPIDVIEIDAASNRKVEDTQNILEKIQYVPVHGKYKIYIIDEVHMLTNHAFNALLKTLEEPPENVIFILATTEVHKVLDTIKSRCQRFDFRRITTEDIVKHLRYISDEEKINISDDALYAIAKNSAGGMRDSISLLDQLSLLGASKQVTAEDVNAILGRISFDILHSLSEKIIASSHNEAIEIINEIYNSGNEPLQILTNLAEYFKNLLVVKNCRTELLPELTGLNEQQIEKLVNQKDKLETQQIVFLLERTNYYIKEIKLSTNQQLWLEIGIIDLANMTENTTLMDLSNRVRALEGGEVSIQTIPRQIKQPLAQTEPPVTRPAPIQPKDSNVEQKPKVQPEQSVIKTEQEFTPPPMSKKPSGNDIKTLWEVLLSNVSSPPTKALLNLATPVKISPEEVIITFKNEKLISQITGTNKKDILIQAANTMFNQQNSVVHVRLPLAGDEALASQSDAGSSSVKSDTTPLKSDTQEQSIKKKSEITSKKDSGIEKNETLHTDNIKSVKNSENAVIEKKQEEPRFASDQEKMVLDLFDGKFIE